MSARTNFASLVLLPLLFVGSPAAQAPAPTAAAKSPAGAPSLAQCVPAGTHLFVRADGRAPMSPRDARIAAAFRKLGDSGILQDVIDLATMEAPPEEREQIVGVIHHVLETLGKVEWTALFSGEHAFGYRFTVPVPEFIVLTRVPQADVARHLKGLRELLDGLASLAPNEIVVKDPGMPGRVASLVSAKQPIPIGIHIGNVDDTIAITTSQPMLASCLKMLRDGKGEGSLGAEAKYRAAMELLPKDRDAEMFFDIAGYGEFVVSLLEMAQAAAPPGNGGPAQFMHIFMSLMDEVSAVRSESWARKQVGPRTIDEVAIQFETGSLEGLMAKLATCSRTLENLNRIAPKDALSFEASAGRDPVEVYDAIVKTLLDAAPESAQFLEKWEILQQSWGIHVREDVLGWWTGEWSHVELPGAAKGSSENVWTFRAKDPKSAASRLTGLLGSARAFLASRGQEMRIEPLTGSEGLQVVSVEAFPHCHPVFGVADGAVTIATSSDAAARVAAARKGTAPSFAENPRFQALALDLKGQSVSSLAFADVDQEFACLSQLVSGAGFGLSLMPSTPKTQPQIKVGALLTKLGRFLREIDGPTTFASYTTTLGKDGVLRTRVTTIAK